MFEFRFRGKACGYPSGASKPLGMLPSLKGWNGEFVFLQGVDIRFMPTFKENPLAMHFEVFDFQDAALDRVNAFCRGLGRQVTRDDLVSHKYRSEIGCLPGYNPEFEKFAMDKSNASLHAALLGIGQVRDNTKVPGEASGSRTQQEGESTSKAPEVAAADVDGDELPLNPRKRNRSTVRQEKLGDWGSDCEVVPSGAHSGKDAHFQPHVPAAIAPEDRNFIGFLAGLPSQKEWDEMGQSSAISLFEDAAAVYGQLGVRFAGAGAAIRRDMELVKEAREAVSSVAEVRKLMNEEVDALKKELADVKEASEARAKELKEAAKTLQNERDLVRTKWRDSKDDVKKLREELKSRKSEEEVIAEFRDSDTYNTDLAKAAASKIHRCWVVAENMCKTDPESATWERFVPEYMKDEAALARGEGEPTLYKAPSSSPPEE